MNFLTRLLEVVPEAKTRYDEAFMEQVRKDAEAVKAKQKESICKECKQPKPQAAWTKASLDSMAREVDPELEKLYGVIYLEGTGQVHASVWGSNDGLRDRERVQLKGIFQNEASLAVQFARRLLLNFIDMQNRHFGMGHEQAIGDRFAAYNAIWGESQASAINAPESA